MIILYKDAAEVHHNSDCVLQIEFQIVKCNVRVQSSVLQLGGAPMKHYIQKSITFVTDLAFGMSCSVFALPNCKTFDSTLTLRHCDPLNNSNLKLKVHNTADSCKKPQLHVHTTAYSHDLQIAYSR